MVDAKRALQIVDDMKAMAVTLQEHPQLVPVAQWIFEPVLNGAMKARRVVKRARPVRKNRTISNAERKRRSQMMKARWAAKKKAGKTSL